MCTRYALHHDNAALRAAFDLGDGGAGDAGDDWRRTFFPQQLAPVVRRSGGGARQLLPMRWGFPPPLGSKRPVLNVRNLHSAFWRPWLVPAQRCLVPMSSFCEYTDQLPKLAHWFGLAAERPLAAFAGIWRLDPEGQPLFAFLTCVANGVVAPIHAKAMPVVLAGSDAWETWLTASTEAAMGLQQPLPDAQLQVVRTGVAADSADPIS